LKITHLKYHQIDFKKYDNCIDTSYNAIIYAYSWYLDIVTKKNWEVLILGDYKAVMPLPFSRIKRKLFKKMIAQPFFCQQLGVFSLTELTQETFNLFLTEYQRMSVFNYQFNHFNNRFLENIHPKIEKVNYELSLNTSYDKIKKTYHKNLKRNLKKAQKNNLIITKNITINQFFKLKKEHSIHTIKQSHFKLMEALITKFILLKKGQFYGVLNKNQLVAIGFFMVSNKRIIHQFSVSNLEGKSVAAIPFLFDYLIQEHANSNVVFDFEGSMITGIAQFFKSFGAENKSYICHQC